MEKEKIQHFKQKLINEQTRVSNLIDQMKQNGVINSNSEMGSELSFYDNHPSDMATELFDKEKGIALKNNEVSMLNKIEEALKNIENNNYGKCSRCGKTINEERLEFTPYAQNCIQCQKSIDNSKPAEQNNRSVEEDVLGTFFKYNDGDVGMDQEDTYQAVERFNSNKLDDIVEYNDDDDNGGYVEPIEKISNDQYKNQLPD